MRRSDRSSTRRLVDGNVDDQSIYNGLDVSFNARLIAGSTLFGSWTTERNVSVFCASDDNPNGPPVPDLYTGASVASGGRFCDQRNFDIPFVHEFKFAGSYPVPIVGMDVAVVLQSYAGLARTITYQPAAGLFPGGRTNTETIILNEPGSLYYPRYNQLDLNFKKNFRRGRQELQRADRLLQRAERQRDLRAAGHRGQLARRRDDDPPGTVDAPRVPDEVLAGD